MFKKHEHKFIIVWSDKINGHAVVILACEKCGEKALINDYVGINEMPR